MLHGELAIGSAPLAILGGELGLGVDPAGDGACFLVVGRSWVGDVPVYGETLLDSGTALLGYGTGCGA